MALTVLGWANFTGDSTVGAGRELLSGKGDLELSGLPRVVAIGWPIGVGDYNHGMLQPHQQPGSTYTVILQEEPDGGYVAVVPALPGCVSQGDSRDEALRNIREAIELYIEDCLEAGDPVPTESGREYVDVRLSA